MCEVTESVHIMREGKFPFIQNRKLFLVFRIQVRGSKWSCQT